MSNTTTRTNKKAVIEDRLLDMMMQSQIPLWKQPWAFAGYDTAFKGKAYRGVNTFATAAARMAYGFESHVWLTETKIQELNGKVFDQESKKFKRVSYSDKFYYKKTGYNTRKVPIAFFTQVQKKDKTTGEVILDENGDPETYPFLSYTYVYNASDVAGLEDALVDMEPASRILSDADSLSALEIEKRLLSMLENAPKVVHNADKACYSPVNDTIYMPPVSTFVTKDEYISAFAHELGHSIGHKSRLNRIGCSFDNNVELDEMDKAKEELIAEIFAAITSAMFGVEEITLENSASYLQSWYNRIKANPGMLFDAIAAADKAYEYLTANLSANEETAEVQAV